VAPRSRLVLAGFAALALAWLRVSRDSFANCGLCSNSARVVSGTAPPSGRAGGLGTIIGKPRDMIYLSSMQRALVTAGAGFIGSHVTAVRLRAGFRVRILDNLSPQFHGGRPFALARRHGQCQAANAELSARGMVG